MSQEKIDKYIDLWRNDNNQIIIRCKNVSIDEIKSAKDEFLLDEKIDKLYKELNYFLHINLRQV